MVHGSPTQLHVDLHCFSGHADSKMAASEQKTANGFSRNVSNDSGHGSLGKNDSLRFFADMEMTAGSRVEQRGVLPLDSVVESRVGVLASTLERVEDSIVVGFHVATEPCNVDSDSESLCKRQAGRSESHKATDAAVTEQMINQEQSHSDSECAAEKDSHTTGGLNDEVDFETLETRAIREFYSELSKRIENQLNEVSGQLYSKRLIGQAVLQQVIEVAGDSNQTKALKVLNAVENEVSACQSKFEAFLGVLEKCDLEDSAESVRAFYNKMTRLSPIGNSDSEMFRNSPSETPLRRSQTLKSKVLKRGDSHPVGTTSDRQHHLKRTNRHSIDAQTNNVLPLSDEEGAAGDRNIERLQVLQLNIEVLELKQTIRKLNKTINLYKTTNTNLQVENKELVARMRNLELQNKLLLRQQSLIRQYELTDDDDDIDYPGPGRPCQSCCIIGNFQCKESVL